MTKQKQVAPQRRPFRYIFSAALWLFPFWLATPVFAQLQITSFTPRLDDIHAAAFTDIRVGFDRALNSANLPANAIQVWGNFHGRYAGTRSYVAANQTLIFTPSQSFMEGEEVTVVVSAALRGTDDSALARPFVWRFLIRTDYGTGAFTPVPYDLESALPLPGVNQEPTHLVAADFNNDAFVDLAVVHHGSNRISVLRNTVRETLGGVLFAPFPNPLATENTPVHAVAADLNNDSNLDLAVVNFNGNSLQIFPGNGAGQFFAPQTIPTGARPIHVLAQDFDGDGDIDLAVTLFGADRIDFFLNNGAGNFPTTPAQSLPVGFGPVSAAAWDFDQNGTLDVTVANNGSKSLLPLSNNGRASFTAGAPIPLPMPPVDLISGDVRGANGSLAGDGQRELLALCSDLHFLGKAANPSGSQAATSVLAIVSFENNRFLSPETVSLNGYAQAFTLCNVDTLDTQRVPPLRPDRDLDMFYTRFHDDKVSWLRNPDNQPFDNAVAADLDTVASAKAIAHFDLDRDGDNDLVVSNYLQNRLVVYLNQGNRVPPCAPLDSLGNTVTVVDFGNVWVRRSDSRRLLIANPNSQQFSFNTMLSDSINFGVAPRRGTVPAMNPVELNTTFTPTDTLPYQSNLFITTNDVLASTSCSVILRGHGVRATIVVPDSLDFGCVPPGQTSRRQLRIQNSGNIPLILSGATNATSYFALQASLINQQIAPRSFIDVPIIFTPDAIRTFRDSLKIGSNDLDLPVATIYLRGCGSLSAPTITSNDTLYATEDVLATYIATATDPDGSTLTFAFENLPGWLQQISGNTVQGTPREGNGDTTFTVIAADGFNEARLQVIVIVRPASDAPVFDPIADQTIFEQDRLTLNVIARDPENDPLTLSVQYSPNFPINAGNPVFTDQGNGQGLFSWRPDFGTAGQYAVTFTASEQNTAERLTDELIVEITVLKRQPDLYIADLSGVPQPARLNQVVTVTATFADSSAPAAQSFAAQLFYEDQLLADTLITSLQTGATVSISRPFQLTALGRHFFQAVTDANNTVAEANENNNTLRLEFEVQPGQLTVTPNPFTPNGDLINDTANFELGNVGAQSPQLKIFDLQGNLLRTIASAPAARLQWDGNDNSGRPQPPGPYLYLLFDAEKKVASGYVVLAR